MILLGIFFWRLRLDRHILLLRALFCLGHLLAQGVQQIGCVLHQVRVHLLITLLRVHLVEQVSDGGQIHNHVAELLQGTDSLRAHSVLFVAVVLHLSQLLEMLAMHVGVGRARTSAELAPLLFV